MKGWDKDPPTQFGIRIVGHGHSLTVWQRRTYGWRTLVPGPIPAEWWWS